ncbi:hypothetical protein Tco_0580841 [Tanacetum coccineum]
MKNFTLNWNITARSMTSRERWSEGQIEDVGSRGGNLPPLLATHLRRSENGLPSQSNLTSRYGGNHPSSNTGGNLPPNDSTRCVTPFVHWIEDYPLPDGLKMPSHVGSYDGKGDPDNYLHLFESAIHDTLQILGLHKEQRISGFGHGLKTRSLVEFLSTDLPTTYKGQMEKNYTWIEANKGKKKNQDRFSPYKGSNHGFLTNLSKSLREILAMEKAAKTFKQPPRIQNLQNTSSHIKEAGKTGQLAHLVKGLKKGKAKASDTQLGEWKKGDTDILPVEAPILMISRESQDSKRKST